jgi:hypothetical protein
MKLTAKNYYGHKSNLEFMSVSQFKRFAECEAAALAELKGEYEPDRGRALLLGSYVDEMLTGTKRSREKFVEENQAELFKKNGEPYADVAQASEAVLRVKKQHLMMHYLSGKNQTIMTGKIAGVPFKGKFDSYKPGEFISDLKYVRSLRSPNLFENFIDYWKYTLQMAVYQELVYQNTGDKLPCYIVAVTKETPAHVTVCEIDQFTLDKELEEVKRLAPRYQKIKNGEIEPERCEAYECEFCTETKVLKEPIPYELITMSAEQIKTMRGEI